MVDAAQSSVGYIPRDVLKDVFNGNQRMIKGYDFLQDLVLNDPFTNAGDVVNSATTATKAIPIIINGVTYYIKLSTAP